MPSTKEFINNLQEATINKESLKNQINQLLTVVGDIWYITLSGQTGLEYIFGKSRLQCQNLINDETKKYNILNNPKLLINDVNEITANEINLYKIMVDCIKTNNINKCCQNSKKAIPQNFFIFVIPWNMIIIFYIAIN